MSNSAFSAHKKETILIPLKKNARFKVALAFPNSYAMAMSNLGVHTIYDILNKRDDTLCERVFFERKDKQFLSLENKRPLKEFDIIAFSISYELDYLNFFTMLSRVFPVLNEESREIMPLVIVGGVVNSFNFKALSKFCDCVFIGEAEESLPAFMDALSFAGQVNTNEKKMSFLNNVAHVKGIFVPGITEVDKTKPALIMDVNKFPTSSKILTPCTEFSNTFLIEIARGCPWACNFCVTGAVYAKFRPRSFNVIKSLIDFGLSYTSRIGLLGAAVTEHPQIDKIAAYLTSKKAKISVSSLRVETVKPAVLEALALSGQKTITFAPEAGSDRLRFLLNKKISNEQILEKVLLSKKLGMQKIKLYFMIGLPRETDKDIIDITKLIKAAGNILPLKVNIGIFVPKPRTAFANEIFQDKKTLQNKLKLLRGNLNFEKNIILNVFSIKQAMLEALFSHADENFFAEFLKGDLL